MDYRGQPQTVLSSTFTGGGDGRERFWLDRRVFPSYVAAASLLVLVARSIWNSQPSRRLVGINAPKFEAPSADSEGFLARRGGAVIVIFKLARLAGVLALLVFTLLSAAKFGRNEFWVDFAQVAALAYASLLAVLNVFSAAKRGLAYSLHLSLVTFAILAVYAYRDVWPLMTFALQPKDGHEGVFLWTKLALAAFVGAIEPMFEPYPYVPYNSDQPRIPSPEQTASLFFFITYIWLDPTIWQAYRIPHLPADELPPLCDYDETQNLIKRAYPSLDTFSGAKKRHLFWGLIIIFRRSLILQSIMLIIFAMAAIAVPIGTNRLLHYLETDGEGATVKPWVWILWLGGGPAIQATVSQYYLFLSTGTLVRVQAIVTSLVFDHALRIRFKAETGDKEADVKEASAPSSSSGSDTKGSATPDNASEGGDDRTVHSRAETGSSTATAGTSSTTTTATVVPLAPGKGKDDHKGKKEDKKDDKKDSKKGDVKKGRNLAGKINNLVTSDLDNVTSGREFLVVVLAAPLLLSFGLVFLYQVLGWSSFVGLAVMIVLLPVPTWVASLMQGVQKQKMKATDGRVQSVTEVMSVLRMVKLFGWESRVNQIVVDTRENELNSIWKRKVLRVTNSCVNYCIPLAHMVVTYAVYTLIMKRELTASIVFSSVTAFEMMRSQMSRVIQFIPMCITANVSLGRVTDFLRGTELLDAFTETPAEEVVTDASEVHKNDIGFGRANFSWSKEKDDGTLTPSRQTFRLRIDDEVHFKKGAFNLIIGPTGSGKTSVLMALLGEMHYIPLGPDAWVSLPRGGGIAYAAQESWVQNETIKENILFGAPYDEERYKKVIYQCGLTRDLSLFDAGDATEVGEKGLTLSGGQKARITLARAVYSSAETLLLDDVLAALDVHTSRWIVNKCFKGELIRGRTVLLVTHNVAMASPLAEFVVSLRDGHIVGQGSVSDALMNDAQLEEEFKHEEEVIELDEAEDVTAVISGPADPGAPGKKKEGKLVVAEEIEVGHVSWAAFKLFLAGLGGRFPFLFWIQYIFGSSMAEVFGVLEMWWLGYWARQYALQDPSGVRVGFYLGIYCACVGGMVMMHVYAQLIYTFASIRASRAIHVKLVKSLLSSTFRWLDVTPMSRVTTRCTQDIQAIDGPVPQSLDYVFQIALTCTIKVGAVCIFTPYFLLPAVFIAGFGGFLGEVYMKAQLSVKREMSTAKAPVLGVFGSAMTGLTSIRAYDAQQTFRIMIHERIDRYVRAARSFYNVNRWIGIRLDLLGQLYTASLAFYFIYGPIGVSPSVVGFVISQATGFSDLVKVFIRLLNELEVNGNSLERVKQYVDIDHEPEPEPEGVPPAYWPSGGDLRVEKLSARYSLDGPKVLQDVTFHAKPGERVGIVGRTGSGKSTLTLALLRCIYTEGKVIYDGLDTKSTNLDALRSNITIIPQVPELLSGSLRHNLDVFGQYDDATLNDALRAAGLFSLQKLSDESRITLDIEVASGGGNLSVGQRQIIALARAIVRQSKLLILDEATSAIDYETDAVIQSSLRTELKSDVTVITVAHRLQTIMDYDKIMVLDAGRLVEYDAPMVLLREEGSFLRALVDESADKETLYAMAEGKARP
ncbi:uncharacterized protein PHACADRAFT_208107 [Phanerochaete carnosa HHB-10118-sp]|uniref:ABC transporter n=1 Tax=Phanerochaete carnosa (strain HHB-10118-sp) TaxID=650164 RepID=K5VZD5_PHACS|nr:uncharacterized protein PHACADRAFT_208107 [Phanerochaete carnosa HHB-10118-sp]EKM56938.1 hypothetical protein PHACADRAFT_208107 [Phanerochaete carnosa HHB-10118-sp]